MWRGPCLLAILKRQGQIETVRSELLRIASVKIQKTVEVGNRSVMLPISMTWMITPMLASARLVAHKIDAFVTSQIPRE